MTILGQAGTVFIGNRMRFIQGQGWTTVAIYKNDSPADAQAFAVSNAGIGQNVDADLTRPPYYVEISTPSSDTNNPDEFVDRWEIVKVSADLSVMEHPGVQGISDETELDLLNTYFADRSAENWQAIVDDTGSAGTMFDFATLIKRGTDHFQNASTSLVWTRTIGDGYASIGGTYNSANKIWTAAQLINIGPPALYAAAISAADTALPSPAAGYYGGWLKSQPDIRQRGSNRSDIVQEWILANWSTTLYAFA